MLENETDREIKEDAVSANTRKVADGFIIFGKLTRNIENRELVIPKNRHYQFTASSTPSHQEYPQAQCLARQVHRESDRP